MDETIRRRMKMIKLISQGDAQYRRMLAEICVIEKKYDAVLQRLSIEEQNAVCDFVSQCEEMSEYQLQLACTYMRFPE